MVVLYSTPRALDQFAASPSLASRRRRQATARITTSMGSQTTLRVLGLDPGSQFTGWGCITIAGARSSLVACGRIAPPAGDSLALRLAHLAVEIEQVLARWQPEVAVLEAPFHGINSRSLIVLAQARGALLATLARAGLPVSEYTPAEVKSAVTGNGRAGKDQVGRMVALLLPGAAGVAVDAADALAVALCFAARRPLAAAAAAAARR
jgi:crossover junction endodeoxyribonuclease RuvC